MRLFLAIQLSDEVREHLVRVRQAIEPALPQLSYTRAENLHLTLKFLGEVDPKKLPAITESLAKISFPQLSLHAAGIECFPHRGPIKVITAALDGTVAPLRALVEWIEQRCKFLGFEKEQRVYRPHVTLARARPVLSQKFRAELEDLTTAQWPSPPFRAREFLLMQSQMSGGGSTYILIQNFACNFSESGP